MSTTIVLPVVGSAGRTVWSVRRREPRQLRVAPGHSDYSSFCLTCASWYFSESRQSCSKCGSLIFRWIPNCDLRFFQSRTSLRGF